MTGNISLFLATHHCSSVIFLKFGSHLLSHAVTSIVPSAAWVLTIVFGMGTGVSPRRIATKISRYHAALPALGNPTVKQPLLILLERR